ncbi:uncharacterized protein UDID_20495 [Ustilago sp. UG-2017a]|nr:uncharacterized protein UDID_20495 [Ustilago sp. UG-2017a]
MVRGKEFSVADPSTIVTLHEQGMSYARIASSVGVAKTTVFKTLRNFKERGNLETAPRSGRPRTCTERQRRRLVRQALKEPTLIWKQLSAELNGLSTSCVRKLAYEAGLSRRISPKKPVLTVLTAARRSEKPSSVQRKPQTNSAP